MPMFSQYKSGFLVVLALALMTIIPDANAQQNIPYGTGFESPTHTVGQNPAEGWVSDSATSVVVTSEVTAEGVASLKILAGGIATQSFNSSDPVVYVNGMYRGEPSDELPDLTKLTSGSALVAYTSTSGVLCLDGNGDGTGTWVQAGQSIDSNTWYQVTLMVDYGSTGYSCFIDGSEKLQNLGFLYNSTTSLNGFQARSGRSTSFLDDFSVSLTGFDSVSLTRVVQLILGIGDNYVSNEEVNQANVNGDTSIGIDDIQTKLNTP